MTDPPLQAWIRYIAIDIHKHYLMIGGIDAHKRIVLAPRRVELHRADRDMVLARRALGRSARRDERGREQEALHLCAP